MKLFYIFLSMAAIQGCIGTAHNEKLNGGYFLLAIDTKSDMEIVYKNEKDYMFSVVNKFVFAIGQNDSFIIAKQHPVDFYNNPNFGITNYFIITLTKKIAISPEKNIHGPFNFEEFTQKKKILNIPTMKFTIIF